MKVKVKAHTRKGKMVKAHTREILGSGMKDYLSSTSLKNPNWGKKKDGTIDYSKPPKKEGIIRQSQDWKLYREHGGDPYVVHRRTYEDSKRLTEDHVKHLKKLKVADFNKQCAKHVIDKVNSYK